MIVVYIIAFGLLVFIGWRQVTFKKALPIAAAAAVLLGFLTPVVPPGAGAEAARTIMLITILMICAGLLLGWLLGRLVNRAVTASET